MANPNVHLDWDNLTDRYMAARACGDTETMREVAGQIKISPGMALAALQNMGKEAFIALGYDLSRVESELGQGWLEHYGN
jgi:hypothetical protein